MYTIGPKSGVGKLNQPGTRGLVVDDGSFSSQRPSFQLVATTHGDTPYKCVGDNGYFFEEVDGDGDLYREQSAPYTDDLGLTSMMSVYKNSYWVFPRDIGSFTYAWDDTRYGNKPAGLNVLDYWNRSGLRAIKNPTQINKWEAHVVISSLKSSLFDPPSTLVAGVYVPYVAGGTRYGYYALQEISSGTSPAGRNIRYFMREVSSNLPSNSTLFYPVFRLSPSTQFEKVPVSVQTKFCFKAD